MKRDKKAVNTQVFLKGHATVFHSNNFHHKAMSLSLCFCMRESRPSKPEDGRYVRALWLSALPTWPHGLHLFRMQEGRRNGCFVTAICLCCID